MSHYIKTKTPCPKILTEVNKWESEMEKNSDKLTISIKLDNVAHTTPIIKMNYTLQTGHRKKKITNKSFYFHFFKIKRQSLRQMLKTTYKAKIRAARQLKMNRLYKVILNSTLCRFMYTLYLWKMIVRKKISKLRNVLLP